MSHHSRAMFQRKGISAFGRFITIAAVLLLAILIVAFYYHFEAVGYGGAGTVGMVALAAPPVLLMVGLGSTLMIFWSFEKRWRLAFVAFSGSVVVSLYLALAPSYALWRWSRKNNVSLNIAEAVVPQFNKANMSRTTTVVYDTLDDGTRLTLDAWPAVLKKKRSPRPAIVKVHGGTWVSGSRKNLTMWNSWFNQLGYHVFDVDYRMPPPERWLEETGDIKCAMGWVRDHAAEYNVDTTRLILMGCSAGANLAMLAAYSYDHPQLTPSCGTPVEVRCVINLYGPSDMNSQYSSTGSSGFVQERMRRYIGGSPHEVADRYNLLSPLSHISGNAPPTISIYGEKDRIVPFTEGIAVDDAMTKVNVPHELYILPETDHAFDANWSYFSTQIAREKIRRFLVKYAD